MNQGRPGVHVRVFDARVGDRVVVEPKGVGDRFMSVFVGWDAGRYLIVKMPSNLALKDHLYPDKPVVLRYLHCTGEVHGCETTIETSVAVPHRLLFLRHPESVEAVSLRKDAWVNCSVPALLRHEAGNMAGYLLDVSRGGCKVAYFEEEGLPTLAAGTEVQCSFRLPGGEQPVEVGAVVRNVAGEGGRIVCGLEFRDAPEPVVAAIGAYVDAAVFLVGTSCADRVVR